MLRSPLLLAVAALAAAPVQAAVSGTLHINAGYSDVSAGLVPDVHVNFNASTEPQTLTYQQGFPNAEEPPQIVYSRSANAMMDGSDGELSGYIDVELDGIPPNFSNSLGIYAKAYLLGIDYFTVDSEVLDPGDEVEVAFRLAVEGNGPVDAQLQVYRILSGGAQTGVLHLSYGANQTSDSFTGMVGELYKVEYHLQVDGGLTPYGLSDANPTKFLVSDYIAHVYGGTTQPAVVSLGTNSGHDYSEPVPEPSAEALAASVFLVLGWRLQQCARSPRV